MNLTVGPLPPAVYWRRRALVAGVLVLLILVIAYSCGGSSGSGATGQRSSTNTPATSSPTPTQSELRPQVGAPPSGDPSPSVTATTAAAPPAGPVDPATELCADTDLLLTPAIVRLANGSYKTTLKIRNTSTRNCKRDVGSKPQELHVLQNGQTVWSSDSCQSGQGESNVATLSAGIEYAYDVIWDGTSGAKCTGGNPLPPGTYQVVAKLDTKVSAPVSFTIPGK
jgi:hypothetical protein